VAVIGRPNVGKSTLTNALVGAKVSIVSNRPQTTRHRLLGIASYPEGQIVLVDTPGLHRAQKRAMNRVMNRAARGSLEGVDAGMLVIEAGRWDDEDTLAFNVLSDSGIPVVLVVNKIDRLKDKGEREGQKAIVIGKAGTRLKEIGAKSRLQMERLFGAKVFLETWVRVREGWSDDEAALKAFGYE
jgi:small GTP-binding protein